MTNSINGPSSNFPEATRPSNHLAAPSNASEISFAQLLSASGSGNSGSGHSPQSLTQAMSSFHASGIQDKD